MRFVNHDLLLQFLARLDEQLDQPARLLLVAQTIQVFEGWRPVTNSIDFAAEAENVSALEAAIHQVQAELGVSVNQESPADYLPLLAGFEERSRETGWAGANLSVGHFDPYIVSILHIARGDEPDYHAVMRFLQADWITVEELDRKLEVLLPQFSYETIQQDAAEFRRRYKGMLQMWRSVSAGAIHRHTPT